MDWDCPNKVPLCPGAAAIRLEHGAIENQSWPSRLSILTIVRVDDGAVRGEHSIPHTHQEKICR